MIRDPYEEKVRLVFRNGHATKMSELARKRGMSLTSLMNELMEQELNKEAEDAKRDERQDD